jgi:hypothetical protein
MKDEAGKVIYVGKSVNLKSRVSSYFQDTGSLTMAKKHMVGKIRDIETILCQTEVEALVLETNLIKHLTPKYNILMKDDKNLAYIKITNSPVPEVYKTRQKIRDGAIYFGPFTSGANIHETVKTLKRICKIRNCRMQFALRSRNSGSPHSTDVSSIVPDFCGTSMNLHTDSLTQDSPQNLPQSDDSYLFSSSSVYITDKAGKTVPCMDYYI